VIVPLEFGREPRVPGESPSPGTCGPSVPAPRRRASEL